MHLNLAGVLLGNSTLHFLWQYKLMPTYAYENRLTLQAGILCASIILNHLTVLLSFDACIDLEGIWMIFQ